MGKNKKVVTLMFPIILIGLFFGGLGFAQAQTERVGAYTDTLAGYKDMAPIVAKNVYNAVAKLGYGSKELYERLGDIYYFEEDYVKAAEWYRELFNRYNGDGNLPIHGLRYAHSLKALGNLEEANKWYTLYFGSNGVQREEGAPQRTDLGANKGNKITYRVVPLQINTGDRIFGGVYNHNKLVFSSNPSDYKRLSKKGGKKKTVFLDLFEAELDSIGNPKEPTRLKGDVNIKGLNQSSAVFTKDGSTMYFTGNNTALANKREVREVNLNLFRAHLVNGEWTNVERLSINNDQHSFAHPALSPNEDILYFSSNMESAIGGTDLYFAVINKDGTLGSPINLGEMVNTVGNESFPFVSDDNVLYFSSDGHSGLGGYDVFSIALKENGLVQDTNLFHLEEPINSSYDDFAFYLNGKHGFISSNRNGGMGMDDMYAITQMEEPLDTTTIKFSGQLKDKINGAPLANAKVVVLDLNNNPIATDYTDANGDYQIAVEAEESYMVRIVKDGYFGDDIYIKKGSEAKLMEHNFAVEPSSITIEDMRANIKYRDIGKILNIVLYFAPDQAEIVGENIVELEKIVSLMKENPGIKLDIGSHTDSLMDDDYNMRLSQRRAIATLSYLVKRGISSNRLWASGYGETQLVNHCSNGVKCTQKEHQQNRRSEFKLRMD